MNVDKLRSLYSYIASIDPDSINLNYFRINDHCGCALGLCAMNNMFGLSGIWERLDSAYQAGMYSPVFFTSKQKYITDYFAGAFAFDLSYEEAQALFRSLTHEEYKNLISHKQMFLSRMEKLFKQKGISLFPEGEKEEVKELETI